MPAFPGDTTAASPYLIKDATKSWGIYGTLSDKIVWLAMDGVKDAEMTVSLRRSSEPAGDYDVAIWGPGMASVNCTLGDDVTHDTSKLPEALKEAIGSSEALVLRGDAKGDPEYEPFVVNLYWPIGGCKDKFPGSERYNMALVHDFNRTIHYSVGIGKLEDFLEKLKSFTVEELTTMSYIMVRTFVWGGRSLVSIFCIIFFATAFTYSLQLYAVSRRGYTALNRGTIFILATQLAWLGAAGLVGSAAVWISQLIWCYSKVANLGNKVWIAITGHISLPIIFAGLILGLYEPSSLDRTTKVWFSIGTIAAGSLMFFTAWQAYLVFPSFIMLGAFIHLFNV
jgi:hypothetical protein